MIIVRSPLRITLGGGGTDLPSYYRNHGGALISAAIDKYVYVSVIRPFTPGIFLKYSHLEHVDRVDDVQHPIMRETLRSMAPDPWQIEITTLADIPSGTGLGSSGAFTAALVKALSAFEKKPLETGDIARLACEIEIDRLASPVGKQDQYISAYGGITCFQFHRNDEVDVTPLKLSRETMFDLEDNLALFFTGFDRSASAILQDQDSRTRKDEAAVIDNLHFVKELGLRSQRALEAGRCAELGEIFHEHWEVKKRRSGAMSNPKIDAWYALARANGAIGGKLVGAGGGGFLMFYAENRRKLARAMADAGLEELRFRFDFDGTRILLQ
jgi:D-glycero-alpha-D-manno-heptose-7-phosphate kinase